MFTPRLLIACLLSCALVGGCSGKSVSLGEQTSGTPIRNVSIDYDRVGNAPPVKSSKLDLLFVVDNSISMADKQGLLAVSIPTLLAQITNPPCVAPDGRRVGPDPQDGTVACPAGSSREQPPVHDLNIGVITSSLGTLDGPTQPTGFCTDPEDNDRALLIGSLRPRGSTYADQGYLKWDRLSQATPPGISDLNELVGATADLVLAAGEIGCGFEMPLEAMYRFLVDPAPPLSYRTEGQLIERVGVDSTVLQQRAAFLRPDSALMVVMLSDENDCSIRDSGMGWLVSYSGRLPRATAACETDPRSECCQSCGASEGLPAHCPPSDANACGSYSETEDHPNLRCFDQKRRFGIDFLFPTSRYAVALSDWIICPDSDFGDLDCSCRMAQANGTPCNPGASVPNPLFAGRVPSQVGLATIVGVPWQNLARDPNSEMIDYMTAAELTRARRWQVFAGQPFAFVQPSDPFMQESRTPREGSNPITGQPILPPDTSGWTINGHEYFASMHGELQYACVMPVAPRDCATMENGGCDCGFDTTTMNPLCQVPGQQYATIQRFAKAYPGLRQLEVTKWLGRRGVVGSICSDNSIDPSLPNFGYLPAMRAISRHIGTLIE
jgi:hypothetical protein